LPPEIPHKEIKEGLGRGEKEICKTNKSAPRKGTLKEKKQRKKRKGIGLYRVAQEEKKCSQGSRPPVYITRLVNALGKRARESTTNGRGRKKGIGAAVDEIGKNV